MVPLDRALVSSYRLSIANMSLTAAVWPQFATQVFRRGIGRLTCIGSYVNKQVTPFTFRAQATTCSKHHTQTVMDACCECALMRCGAVCIDRRCWDDPRIQTHAGLIHPPLRASSSWRHRFLRVAASLLLLLLLLLTRSCPALASACSSRWQRYIRYSKLLFLGRWSTTMLASIIVLQLIVVYVADTQYTGKTDTPNHLLVCSFITYLLAYVSNNWTRTEFYSLSVTQSAIASTQIQ